MTPITYSRLDQTGPPEGLAPLTLKMDNRISFRLYRDTRPHCLEIAPLQKGLVLVLDGRELIEEGAGFGLPVVKYEDKTYFSSTAKTTFHKNTNSPAITKSFCLDTVSRKRLGKTLVNDNFYGFFHTFFEKAYLTRKELAPAFNIAMELRKTLKIETQFAKVPPRGRVKITYTCFPSLLKVQADFSELQKDHCQEILILNEQGSTFFTRYSDTHGLLLSKGHIGAWERVKAEQASLSNSKENLSFTLQNVKAARLFRGWERTRGRFSWAGLGYLLPKAVSRFGYDIQLKTEAAETIA